MWRLRTLAYSLLLAPFSQSASAQAEEINPFDCTTCLGTQLIPYWVPTMLVIFVVTMYMLHFYEKPFPTLEDDDSAAEGVGDD